MTGRLACILCAVCLAVHGVSRRRFWSSLGAGNNNVVSAELRTPSSLLWQRSSVDSTPSKTPPNVRGSGLGLASSLASPTAAVAVWVYLESLCIDSKHFVLNQLVPTYATLGDRVMDLNVVSFGNAQLDLLNHTVTCQHGAAECDANLYEQCAISLYPPPSRHLNYVACLFNSLPMGHSDTNLDAAVFADCARSSALDGTTIRACHDDPILAWHLQTAAYHLTHPTGHTSVPWVTIQGKHVDVDESDDRKHNDDAAAGSFIRQICRAYVETGGSDPACPSEVVATTALQ